MALLLGIFFNTVISAQLTIEDSAGITRERWRDSMFRMNKQYVPTGILLEYSLFPFEASKYDGLNNNDDTLKDAGHLYMLHNILTDSRVNSNANLPETDTLFAKAFWHSRNTGKIPFTLVYQPYNRIRESSLSEGLFTIDADSVGILDVLPRSVSPYDTFYAFFAGPFITSITQFNAISFSFPDSLWQMAGIISISINFDDGSGYHTLTKDTTVNIYYATEGLKLVTIQISTPGGTRTAKCQIDYRRPESWSPPSAVWNFEVDPVYTDDQNYLGGSSRIQDGSLFDCGGTFFQRLLCNEKVGARVEVENGCDGIFDKPVIIVEGFDPDGTLNINELKSRFTPFQFREILKTYGYDFVYVDFTKNGDYIENNAKVLEAVINKVNQDKVGNFKSTVIGFSMGGLIARWCLKDMEDRGLQHQVENYFSYDAPQQGANIPLGMQYLFKEIEFDLPYLRWFNIGGFREIAKANESRAARQMLITKPIYTGPGNSIPLPGTLNDLRAAFAQRLVTKGYPQQTNNYGISFGRGNNTASTKDAGNGIQWNNFGPGTQIFKGNMTWFLANFQSKAYAVQENNVNDYIAKWRFEGLTFRKIFGLPIIPVVVLRIRNFKYTSQYPYDDAPGGYELTQGQFAAVLTGWANGAAVDATTDGHYGHNFVSVASGLDLQNQNYNLTNNWQSNNMFFNIDNFIQNPGAVTGNTLSNPTLSPFDAVITSTSNAFGANLFHNADVSNANALFIIRKILNSNPNFNCLTDGFCNANPSITGLPRFCTTGDYHLINFPSGITITWSSVNGRFRITNGQGTPNINVEKISGGSDIVRVVITNACGASRTFELNITIDDGVPFIAGDYYFNGNLQPLRIYFDPGDENDACLLQTTTTNMQIAGASSVTWSKLYSNPSNVSWSQNGNNLSFYFWNVGQIAIFRINAVNSCGTSSYDFGFKAINCDGGGGCYAYQVSPNPASESVTVSVPNIPPPCFSSSSETRAVTENRTISEIKIFDQSGNLKKLQKANKARQVTVSLTGFRTGVYIIEISDGHYRERQQLIIQQ